MFPTIETLEDVLPHIAPDSGIIYSQHKGYSVVNYVYSTDDTFATAIARECRGLKFAPDGRLIARPFHKFFNLGEKGPIEGEPWSDPHVVADKLDGSMIHPAIVEGKLVFMTRMGRSAQADAAMAIARPEVLALSRALVAEGMTPVFEYTGPENRIVVAYEAPQLTLLAVRQMTSGAYMPQAELEALAEAYDVPTAQVYAPVSDARRFWDSARQLEEVEGYVIAFDNGHRLKVKADAYVLRHKALSGLAHEKNVLAMVATGAVDDVLPLLAPEVAAALRAYEAKVLGAVARLEATLGAFVGTHKALPRKDYAAQVKADLPAKLHSIAFRALDWMPPRSGLIEVLERGAASETRVAEIAGLFDLGWSPPAQP